MRPVVGDHERTDQAPPVNEGNEGEGANPLVEHGLPNGIERVVGLRRPPR